MWRKAIITGLTCMSLASASYALDPIGPPRALLGKGYWSLGIEYAYSEADTDPSNIDSPYVLELSAQELAASRVYANLRYGLWDNVDLFVRAGAATFDLDTDFGRFSGEAGFAWGVGVAATLYHSDKFAWGLLAQFSSENSTANSAILGNDAHLEMDCLQIATGPTYQMKDDLAAYGGIFYDALDGEVNAWLGTWDLHEKGPLGAFAGLDWAVKEDAHLNVEVQYVGTGFAVATGLRWIFE